MPRSEREYLIEVERHLRESIGGREHVHYAAGCTYCRAERLADEADDRLRDLARPKGAA